MSIRLFSGFTLALFCALFVFFSTVSAGEYLPPVFVDQPPSQMSASHCDSMYYRVVAIDPNREHPTENHIRYHLVSGPGEINQLTGLWVYHPAPEDFLLMSQVVEIAASIGSGPQHMTPTEEYCRFEVRVLNDAPHIIIDGLTREQATCITEPGFYSWTVNEYDSDWCDPEYQWRIDSIVPTPVGSFDLSNGHLTFRADSADMDNKFVVTLTYTIGDKWLSGTEFIFDTHDSTVPVFVYYPDTAHGSVCEELREYLRATTTGIDDFYGSAGLSYELVSGPGDVSSRGCWTYRPTPDDIGRTFEVEVAAMYCNAVTSGENNCRFTVSIGDQPPGLRLEDAACGGTLYANYNSRLTAKILAYADDWCHPMIPVISSVSPTPYGVYELTNSCCGSSRFEFWPDTLDMGQNYTFVLSATDGDKNYTCSFNVKVRSCRPSSIAIGHTSVIANAEFLQNPVVPVAVSWSGAPGNGMSAFDFLIAYDADNMRLDTLTFGATFGSDSCDWEYLTYRFGSTGDCGSLCPSGLLNIKGIANYVSDSHRPQCLTMPVMDVLFRLDFALISSEVCNFNPVRFYWTQCSDNSLVSVDGNVLMTSYEVLANLTPYSHGFIYDPTVGYPTFTGAQNVDCAESDQNERVLYFINGGINVRCLTDSLIPGDLNLSGDVDLGDMLIYTDYFRIGNRAFWLDIPRQTAASDFNQDGVTLHIQDLYLLKELFFPTSDPDQLCSTNTSPNTATFFQSPSGVIHVDTPDTLLALYMVFSGQVEPIAEVPGLTFRPFFDGSVTRVLIEMETGMTLSRGPLLSNAREGTLVEIQAITNRICRVNTVLDMHTDVSGEASTLPTSYALAQNYPNPFNNATVIGFDLPTASKVTFEVINILGRKVYDWTKDLPAGQHRIEWNGVDNGGAAVASGVYYYRLSTEDFSATKKMVLVK